MLRITKSPLIIAMALTLTFGLTGCSSTRNKDKASDTIENVGESTGSSGYEVNGDSDSGKAGGLRTVYYAYDSSDLASSAKATLQTNADWLKANPSATVQIEGHCDERGGIQYNLALGERRAKGAKDYLVSLGVPANRVDVVSYGKERPIEFGNTESAWSKNRRGNFVITGK